MTGIPVLILAKLKRYCLSIIIKHFLNGISFVHDENSNNFGNNLEICKGATNCSDHMCCKNWLYLL